MICLNININARILGLVLLYIIVIQCTYSSSDLQENEDLLYGFVETFNEEDHPIYYQTLPKEKIADYLGEGFSLDHVFFLSKPSDSLEIYFTKEVISGFSESIKNYKRITVTEELTDGHKVVEQKEIPDFVKDSSIPPPFKYSGFRNVYFLSTPLISKNKAVIFIDSYGHSDIGISIYFYVRRNQSSPWVSLGGGSVHELKYYNN